jgi:hypothetical protein
VIIAVLVTGRVELNPGPPVDQGKTGQILAHVHNQAMESKRLEVNDRLTT